MKVTRKQNESIGGFLGRVRRLVLSSHTIQNVKERRFRVKKLNERKEKQRAIMSNALSGLRKNLQRMNQYNDENFSLQKKRFKQTVKI